MRGIGSGVVWGCDTEYLRAGFEDVLGMKRFQVLGIKVTSL